METELLAPAGNIEKLKVSVLYGADAVYLGGQKFGLRSAADNFTYDELREGVEFAHTRQRKVYVVLNSFFHDKDLEELPEFASFLEEIGIDAVILSDLGGIGVLKKYNIPIHLSTQASCLNSSSALFWKEMGVTRIVLGREVSINEALEIKRVSGLEIEMFIHGAMCMAYSGNCVISNYTSGRDSNRGGCAHSCRFEYSFEGKDNKAINSYFMSSKDLEGVRMIPEFIEAGIDSLKVEGRMKSHHYAGTVSKVYSEALKAYKKSKVVTEKQLLYWESELRKISHRDYTRGSLNTSADQKSIYDKREHNDNDFKVVGVIFEVVKNEYCLIEVRSFFYPNDYLEFVPFEGTPVKIETRKIENILGDNIEKADPSTLVKIPFHSGMEKWNIVRGKIETS